MTFVEVVFQWRILKVSVKKILLSHSSKKHFNRFTRWTSEMKIKEGCMRLWVSYVAVTLECFHSS